MASNNDINNLSDEEKLLTLYRKSIVKLQEVVDDGKKTLSIVDELGLPYHIFDWWRFLVEDTRGLYHLIHEFMEGKGSKTLLHYWESEPLSAERKLLLILLYEYRTKFGMWKFHSEWLLSWLEERAELNLPIELMNWCQFLISTVVRIQGLLESLFEIPPIDFQPEDKILQDMQAKWWAYEKRNFRYWVNMKRIQMH